MPERTGIANLPLHGGKAPVWLFQRMVKLSRAITIAIISEYGSDEMLRRLSDPYWFQAFGCILGYDWHSSGVTTVVCGAMKEGIKDINNELGFYVTGGKGGTSRKTPSEVTLHCDNIGLNAVPLIYASKMSAKVDNTAVQDGYQLYHHCFFFDKKGIWAVIQQGMNENNNYARRYHWLSEQVSDFVCEPHSAICAEVKADTLNMVAKESHKTRDVVTQIAAHQKPEQIIAAIIKLKTLTLPKRHSLVVANIHPDRMQKIFLSTYEQKPRGFETLLSMRGVGPQTIRALSLISELIYDTAPSTRDPASFSFAHGGKDGYPHPVNRKVYDQSIEILSRAIKNAKLGLREEKEALQRLYRVFT